MKSFPMGVESNGMIVAVLAAFDEDITNGVLLK